MNDITEVDRLNAEIADLKRTIEWYQGRTGIMMGAAAGAALAAVPASEPVAYLVDWHDIGEGAGKSCFYDADAKQHMESAVSYALHARTRPSTVTPLYAAAHAPVLGMPDLLTQLRNIRAIFTCEDTGAALRKQALRGLSEVIDSLSSPQAPDTPVATEQAAKAIYRLFDGADEHPWIEGGNSTKQDDARRFARAALATRQAPAEPHPLDGLHINKGSMDAASDAYFREWQKSICRTAYENRYHKVAALCPYDEWEACWFKALGAATVPSAK